jgi:hypothetical protein
MWGVSGARCCELEFCCSVLAFWLLFKRYEDYEEMRLAVDFGFGLDWVLKRRTPLEYIQPRRFVLALHYRWCPVWFDFCIL